MYWTEWGHKKEWLNFPNREWSWKKFREEVELNWVLKDDHRECGSRGGQISSPGGAGIIERKLLIRGVFVGSWGGVHKQSRWGKWAREQVPAKQVFLVRMIMWTCSEIPCKILNSIAKNKVWSYFWHCFAHFIDLGTRFFPPCGDPDWMLFCSG